MVVNFNERPAAVGDDKVLRRGLLARQRHARQRGPARRPQLTNQSRPRVSRTAEPADVGVHILLLLLRVKLFAGQPIREQQRIEFGLHGARAQPECRSLQVRRDDRRRMAFDDPFQHPSDILRDRNDSACLGWRQMTCGW
jgi:hypothetical protein